MNAKMSCLCVLLFCAVAAGSITGCASDSKESEPAAAKQMSLFPWELGIGLRSSADPIAFMYLRFYEWNLFDAVEAGEHSAGVDRREWEASQDGQSATLNTDMFDVKITTAADGADIEMKITNTSGHDWPAVAAIIPCLSPEYARSGVPTNPPFFDEKHEHTWFPGRSGLERLDNRDIHFNAEWKEEVLKLSKDGAGDFAKFSNKWPTSKQDAVEGLMVRESDDGRWVSGIAWDDFLTAQGHNPRKCMHLSARVGPLKTGESKTLRGKIYLFPGTKEDCVKRYRKDFSPGNR